MTDEVYNVKATGRDFKRSQGYLTKKIVNQDLEIVDSIDNKIYVADTMEYASTLLAAAAWVAGDTSVSTGVVVTRDTTASHIFRGTSSVLMTLGSAWVGPVDVVKTLTSPINLESYNYIGFPIRHEEAHAATDIDIVLTDSFGNEAYYSLPAVDANHDDMFSYHDIKLDDFTTTGIKWHLIKEITFRFGTTMSSNESVAVDEICFYKISNGKGPAVGPLQKVKLVSNTMLRGSLVKMSLTSVVNYVDNAAADDEEIIGLLCTDGDAEDDGYIQTSGKALMECGAATNLAVGEGVNAASINTFKVGATAGLQVFGSYLGPVSAETLAQYSLGWIYIGRFGTPTA